MVVKVTYSNEYWAKRKRIQRLSKMVGDVISGYAKRDLLEIKKIFHDGIKGNTLKLERLVDETILRKKRKGYQRPTSPLYGKGDREKEGSYANMLEVIKKGNGWILQPSREQHWSGKLSLKDLFKIHEHGATVKRTEESGETTLIKIPPRPALLLSYRRHLIRKRRVKKEQSIEVRRAMTTFINQGSKKKLDEFKTWITKT
jgi:hypothetical protein